MCHVDIIFIRIIVNLTINLACVHHVPLCVATRPIRCPGYVTPRHTTRITNDIQRPTRRNTMLITSATIKWPFPRNSSKHRTRSSMTRRTTSGIPKNHGQQYMTILAYSVECIGGGRNQGLLLHTPGGSCAFSSASHPHG